MTNILGSIASVASSVKSAFTSVGKLASPLGGALPAQNVLSKYASYTYVIGISSMSINDANYPDISYRAGKVLPLICKSAGADPDNRVNTFYGKYDYFLDNLNFESVIGLEDARSTNVTTLQFDIVEPYSLGVFMLSLQSAAYQQGFKNWRDAPFLLTIEFRGNTETGTLSKIPFSTRHIPFKFSTITMRGSEQGSRYSCIGYATNSEALTTRYANLKTDSSIKGKTVQEILQTGEQSLQAVVNQHLKEYKDKGTVEVPDEVVILFPKEIASSASSANAPTGGATASTATAQPSSTAADINKKLGVAQSPVNKTLVQSAGAVNEIGSSAMGFSYARKADGSLAKEGDTVDEKTGKWSRGSLQVNPEEGTLKFGKQMDIPSVINQVLLTSKYAENQLKENKLDNDGMRTWWRIDTQVYYIDSPENVKKTGVYPRILVYRVIPYKAHSGAITAVNEPPPGYTNIRQQVVKEYNYIYTGKNTEILKFDIDFSVGFTNILAADNYKGSADQSLAERKAQSIDPSAPVKDVQKGSLPPDQPGNYGTTQNLPILLETAYDRLGGGGTETPAMRAAKVFHNAITNPNDMVVLNMDIVGDPYWVVNSGLGNYTAKSVDGVKDLNKDGSVNWQNGEVDILVNFRSPFDINQTTGMYDFKSPNIFDISSASGASPTLGFSGLYRINRVTNIFRGGSFRQTLKGNRRPLQESKKAPDPKKTMSSNTPVPESDKKGYATDPNGNGLY
jgi:hypothetical protein